MAQDLTALNAEVWASVLQEVILEKFVGMEIADTKFEGDFNGADKVHFQIVTSPDLNVMDAIGDDVVIDDLEVTDETMTLDYMYSHAIKIPDVSRVEWKLSPENENLRQEASKYANAYDDYIMAEYTNATYDVTDGDMITATNSGTTNPIKLSTTNILDFVSTIVKEMDENNMPQENRWIIVSPEEKQKFVASSELTHATAAGDGIIRTGLVGTVLNVRIISSNNLVKVATVRHLMAGAGKPICFGANVKPTSVVQTNQNTGGFYSIVKSMTKFGVKTFSEGANRLIDVQVYSA